jgi:excisionase family DNA binding protein
MPGQMEQGAVAEREIISEDNDKYVSITEAARLNNVTRQAIYIAIKLGKLSAKKELKRWTIHLNDLANYRKQKYSRSKSTYEGELLFDNCKGYFSINQVAKMLKVPAQKIYYATRSGYMKASRKGAAWVIHTDDIEAYKQKHLEKKSRQDKAS